jgi:hypothetical protein
VEDYPTLIWVYSFEDGWLPVVQTERYRQFHRLEYCTSPKCSNTVGGSCRTFESRVQVLVWNGKDVVGTTVLLQTSCKCMLDNVIEGPVLLPELPLAPDNALPSACNPYTDCGDCRCPPFDRNCFIHRRLNCGDDVRLPVEELGSERAFWPSPRFPGHGGFWRRHWRPWWRRSRSRSWSRSRSGSHSGSGSHDDDWHLRWGPTPWALRRHRRGASWSRSRSGSHHRSGSGSHDSGSHGSGSHGSGSHGSGSGSRSHERHYYRPWGPPFKPGGLFPLLGGAGPLGLPGRWDLSGSREHFGPGFGGGWWGRRPWWRRRHHNPWFRSGSWGSRSRSGSDERCDPYTDCSCPCRNYATRRHCLDYRRRNNICLRENFESWNDFPFEPSNVFEDGDDAWMKKK